MATLKRRAKPSQTNSTKQVWTQDDSDSSSSSESKSGWHFSADVLQGHSTSKNYAALGLKPDHLLRPLWVCNTGRIILEAFSVLTFQAQDFLTAIAEPVSRPEHIHEYRLTEYSLYAAISVGLRPKSIIDVLELLSKSHLPEEVKEFIHKHSCSYGKVKVILRNGRFWLETTDDTVLAKLLNDPIISNSLVMESKDTSIHIDAALHEDEAASDNRSIDTFLEEESMPASTTLEPGLDLFDLFNEDASKPTHIPASGVSQIYNTSAVVPLKTNVAGSIAERFEQLLGESSAGETTLQMTKSFEIHMQATESVKRRCVDLLLPVLEEYDFCADSRNPNLEMTLKPFAKLRPYQANGLSKVFGNGRVRSGVVVLPCGSGKTLVGVAAACTVKKNCLVLCTSSVSAEQWRREFCHWSTIKEGHVAKFTSGSKEKFVGPAGVMISTYTMITYSGKRAYDAQKLMEFIQSREWGLLILDEVHVVPAEMFRKVFTIIGTHSKLGLTATLVREDNKIDNLNYLIGPKLYEANWMELARGGHIARVQCAQVWCDMTPEFFREFLREKSRKRQLLYTMNPRKVQACQYLVNFHEAMGDKIIVFSDNVFALKHYATKLHRPFIYGGTSQSERFRVLQQFRFNPALNTIFLSKVGDTSIDLPEASCLIQISSHYGSRRQEAQRLGMLIVTKYKGESCVQNEARTQATMHIFTLLYQKIQRKCTMLQNDSSFSLIRDIVFELSRILKVWTILQVLHTAL
ncbi:DNA repair helicase RAD25, variant 3 [Batrachochytrium dendrobatidis]|nr:DNA repair helicase RAD25, variant 3 [Batrachochytrium dendrobatidis]